MEIKHEAQSKTLKDELEKKKVSNTGLREKLLEAKTEIKELNQQIANFESDKQRNSHENNRNQLIAMKKKLQHAESELGDKLRKIEQQKELIDTLTHQLFTAQKKSNP